MYGLEQFGEGIVIFITLFVMMVGLIFTVVPPVPGTVVIWAAAVFYGLVLGWDQKLGWLTFGLLTFLMIVGLVVDFVAGHFGAKFGGASCLAIIVGTMLGLVLGILAGMLVPGVGCFAGLLGMIAGILLVEWRRNNDWSTAVKATKGYVTGATAGIMARVTSGVLMFGIFLVRAYLAG
jgi:uncharacterized protein YqgC (DUF456 family)